MEITKLREKVQRLIDLCEKDGYDYFEFVLNVADYEICKEKFQDELIDALIYYGILASDTIEADRFYRFIGQICLIRDAVKSGKI